MDVLLDLSRSLPPITRTWFGASLLVNVGTTLELLRPQDLLFDGHRIYHNLELWRLLAPFLYGGGNLNEIHVLLSLYMITIHSSAYERNPYYSGGNPLADYAFCLLFCIATTVVTFLLVEYYYIYYYGQHQRLLYPVFSRTLITSISYLWARRNPNVNIMLNFIPIQGLYLPFAQMALAWGLGNPIGEMVHGMLVGHIYFYLVVIVPAIRGPVLATPSIFVELLVDLFGDQPEFRRDAPRLQQQGAAPNPTLQRRTNHTNRNDDNNNNDMRRWFQEEGATDAHIAAKIGNIETLRLLSETSEGRESFGAKDNNDWQPLHEAVRGGYIDVVNFLLSFDDIVDKNARTQAGNGPSPLWIAESTHGVDHPVTRRLQELGAVNCGPG